MTQWAGPGPCSNRLHHGSTAMARHPGRANGMPNVTAQLFQPQKQLFITGEVLSEAGRSQRKGVLHPTDRMCLPMLRPIYTQSCGKETPCGKSPSHTRVGPQALLDRVTVFRRAANNLEIQRATNSWNTASAVHLPQSIHPPATCALVDTECHGTPSVAKHASISNSETSPARGSAGSLRTFKNKSTVDTAAALLEGNFTRLRRHRADTYKY